ncbi:MAG: PEP-CTERM sorting domain-containing protein [Pseudomonadota bacterium]
MNKYKFLISLLLLLSYKSSASLMQLTYDNFNAPPSPTNYPVDRTGVVSFVFDDLAADVNLNPFEGSFLNPIKSGYMFLNGIRYDIDTDAPVEFSTQYSGYSSFRATGTIYNNDIGKRNSFSLALYGDFSEAIGETLDFLDLSGCWDRHLNFGDGTFYEGGGVSTEVVSADVEVVAVPEPASVILLILGVAGILFSRMSGIKRNTW